MTFISLQRSNHVMKFWYSLVILCGLSAQCYSHEEDSIRRHWIEQLVRISSPVIDNLSEDSLKMEMPITNRQKYQYLEAFGRTFCGISRWLDLKDDSEEDSIRNLYRGKVVRCFQNGFNPAAADYCNFSKGRQPLVDAAFIAQGLARCPRIWEMLDAETRCRILEEFISLRRVKPHQNNWLLFASMIEVFLLDKTGSCDQERLMEGINAFVYGFYIGDGIYGDGIEYDNNYYNSYVIHPMLMDILLMLKDKGIRNINECIALESKRYHRYVQWLTPDIRGRVIASVW